LEVLDAGLAANPVAYELLQIKASILEARGDIDGAIEIYEGQYERNSGDVRVANNLASLIATYRDDPAELERAYNIARRQRGIAIPAIHDTYGWLEYTQGNYDEALASLEPAAAGLPDEPTVQFHLGMTYAALERRDEAIATLTRAIELGAGRDLPQMAEAASMIETLQAAE
jgi:tetratricopeptide (TPR) repeat protein